VAVLNFTGITGSCPGLKQFKVRFLVYPWEIIYCYNFSTDYGAESKFDRHEDLIVLNILKYKYCVDKSGDMARDHLSKNFKYLTNWWRV